MGSDWRCPWLDKDLGTLVFLCVLICITHLGWYREFANYVQTVLLQTIAMTSSYHTVVARLSLFAFCPLALQNAASEQI
jgi:hypothetical protein